MLVSRTENVTVLANQLAARASVRGLDTDAFAGQIKQAVEAIAFRGLEHSCGGGDEAYRYAESEAAKHNKTLVSQFFYLLMQAEDKYQYRAECLADEIDAKAPHKLSVPIP